MACAKRQEMNDKKHKPEWEQEFYDYFFFRQDFANMSGYREVVNYIQKNIIDAKAQPEAPAALPEGEEEKKIRFQDNGLVDRKYTPEWADSGSVKFDDVVRYVSSLVNQRKHLVLYVEALHNALDTAHASQKVPYPTLQFYEEELGKKNEAITPALAKPKFRYWLASDSYKEAKNDNDFFDFVFDQVRCFYGDIKKHETWEGFTNRIKESFKSYASQQQQPPTLAQEVSAEGIAAKINNAKWDNEGNPLYTKGQLISAMKEFASLKQDK